ncbi:MAG: helix-turn-helix domain-containing protein [Roseivivax sp.]|nr:helix-turn-helix domain-containing protein [Roseivivax sp.]
MPGWVPVGAEHYLAHTERGASIRELARRAGVHASTVLRQVRRMEARRDDPLVDAALTGLAADRRAQDLRSPRARGTGAMNTNRMPLDAETLASEGRRILRRLCEPGAVLAVSPEMERAIVMRSDAGGSGTRTATVDRGVAEAMALKNWIMCDRPGRVAQYRITPDGRGALSRLVAQQENRAGGMAEAAAVFEGAAAPERARATRNEPPLMVLARRREKDGSAFLPPDLVAAGERLREDFELAHLQPGTTQNWEHFLTGPIDGGKPASGPGAGADARARLAAALRDLGPGLGDVALRCCCYLEGLETVERRMGWSARSGKIVLRIALQRLRLHYAARSDRHDLIG